MSRIVGPGRERRFAPGFCVFRHSAPASMPFSAGRCPASMIVNSTLHSSSPRIRTPSSLLAGKVGFEQRFELGNGVEEVLFPKTHDVGVALFVQRCDHLRPNQPCCVVASGFQ